MEIPVESQSIETVKGELSTITAKAKSVAASVVDEASYRGAAEFLKQIKAGQKRVEEVFGSVVKKAHEAWKSTVALRKQLDAPLEDAESMVKASMSAWFVESERKRKDEQRKLEEEARKREEDARIAASASLEKMGNRAAAEAVLAQEKAVAPVILPKAQAAGVSMRETWSAEVVSIKELAKAVAEGRADESLLLPNMTALNGMARALKGALALPGVKAVSRSVVAA